MATFKVFFNDNVFRLFWWCFLGLEVTLESNKDYAYYCEKAELELIKRVGHWKVHGLEREIVEGFEERGTRR